MKININKINNLVSYEDKISLAKQPSPLIKGLFVLAHARELCGSDYLNADEIIFILDTLGININKRGLINSFNSTDNGKIKIENKSKPPKYKAMLNGIELLKDKFQILGPYVLYVDGGKPFSVRKKLDNIFMNLKGCICICDPYLGNRSLDILSILPNESEIKFLTLDIKKLTKDYLNDFQKEYPKSSFRIYTNNDLHDRYIVAADVLLIIGNGIKDIGKKESFIIMIDSLSGKDLINTIISSFNNKWILSNPLII